MSNQTDHDNIALPAMAATGAMVLAYHKYQQAIKNKDKQKAEDYLNILQNQSEFRRN